MKPLNTVNFFILDWFFKQIFSPILLSVIFWLRSLKRLIHPSIHPGLIFFKKTKLSTLIYLFFFWKLVVLVHCSNTNAMVNVCSNLPRIHFKVGPRSSRLLSLYIFNHLFIFCFLFILFYVRLLDYYLIESQTWWNNLLCIIMNSFRINFILHEGVAKQLFTTVYWLVSPYPR